MSKEKALQAMQDYPVYNWYENKANIFGLFLATNARTKRMKKVFDTVYTVMVCVADHNYFTMYMNHKDNDRIANRVLEYIETKRDWFTNARKEIYKRAETLITFSRTLKTIDYKKKTNKELNKLFQEFVELFEEMRIYSSIPTMLEHGNPVLSIKLKEKIILEVPKEKRNEVFSILTTPTKKSYLLEEDLERLKIAAKITKENPINSPAIQKLIKKHTENWNWKEYMFEGTPLTTKDFENEIKKDLKGEDPAEKVKEVETKHKEIEQKQKACIKKYKLSKEIQDLAEAAQDIVYLKYFRKGRFAESYYCMEFLLREIGNRFGLTVQDVQAMYRYEVSDALEHDKINKETIRKRRSWCAFASYDGRCYPLTKEEVNNFIKKNLEREEIGSELKGTVACNGKARGKVCIINDKAEMGRMKEGNILVSMMTNPNMFPAMKKAAAMITDSGGLSCHAAIVARELQIPCIVGTKYATKILKEGMEIEVDGETGTINIINN